jgi:hypothetical protein
VPAPAKVGAKTLFEAVTGVAECHSKTALAGLLLAVIVDKLVEVAGQRIFFVVALKVGAFVPALQIGAELHEMY